MSDAKKFLMKLAVLSIPLMGFIKGARVGATTIEVYLSIPLMGFIRVYA